MKVHELNMQNGVSHSRQAAGKKSGKKKIKKKHKWLKSFIVIIFLAVLLVILALSPLFKITRIDVQGSHRYSNSDIIAASGIETGKNAFKTIGNSFKGIFLFRYKDGENKILSSYPYIKSATIRLHLPGIFKIEIVERTPAFIIPYLGTNLLVDREQYVADAINKTENLHLPSLKGLEFNGYKPGQKLDIKNQEAFDLSVQLMNALEASDKNDAFKISKIVNYIDASDTGNIKIMLDSRILVNLGKLDDLNYRILFLREVYVKHIKKTDKGSLDFTSSNPEFAPAN
ncbi:MAG: FtsQ-type POTRA domain-containing protein [Bacillota bacterium]|nr:FtsQ-type POTRA domain-containing protein [Bacillota bacterium]